MAPFIVPIATVAVGWPDEIRAEVAMMGGATVALPAADVAAGLGKGKVAFTWGQILSWTNPPPSEPTRVREATELSLPLRLIAPAFLRTAKRVEPRKSLAIDDTIPALFDGGPAAAPASAPSTPVFAEPAPEVSPASLTAARGLASVEPSDVQLEITDELTETATAEADAPPVFALEPASESPAPVEPSLSFADAPLTFAGGPAVSSEPGEDGVLDLTEDLPQAEPSPAEEGSAPVFSLEPSTAPAALASREAAPIFDAAPLPFAEDAAAPLPIFASPSLPAPSAPAEYKSNSDDKPAPRFPSVGIPTSVGEIFGQPEKLDWKPTEIVENIVLLPQVAGAVVGLAEGLVVAHHLPEGMKGEVVAAFLPQIFARLNQYSSEMQLGELDDLLFSTHGAHMQIYRLGFVFFAVLSKPGATLPFAELHLISRELARHVQQ
jgi:predicted regulator of Ras-like GTPase activity (Roadblock/LC7/MglB family)